MATVDIDLTESVAGRIDQHAYDDDTVVNFITSGHSSVNIDNNTDNSVDPPVGPTSDILEIQYTFVSPTANHDYLYLHENTHVKLLPGINQPENFEHNYLLDDNATLELSNEFLAGMPAGQLYVISGAGDTIIDATGLDVNTLDIEYTPAEYSHLTFVGANSVEYDQFGGSLTFSDIEGNVVGEASISGQTFDPNEPDYIDPQKLQIDGGTVYYACYLKGTHISTPEGETKVEDLKLGDKVKTASGGAVKVKWIGFRKLNRKRIPESHLLRASPIRICKGAFAENVPHRDLTVSPGHRFDFDGALVPALSLVNGITIVQDFDVQQFEYFHVELEKFDMLLAEGAAAESYLDVGDYRQSFENVHTVAAHPDFGPAPRNVTLAQYVQRITSEIIGPIRQYLFKRAEILTGAVRTPDTDLRIEINGQVISPQTSGKKKGLYRFELPAGLSDDIRILSNAAVVRETSLIDRTDTRIVGVGLSSMALVIDGQRSEIDLTDASLTGFNDVQEIDDAQMRWTTGEAVIPADLIPSPKGAVTLELNVLRTHMYWASVEQAKVRKAA